MHCIFIYCWFIDALFAASWFSNLVHPRFISTDDEHHVCQDWNLNCYIRFRKVDFFPSKKFVWRKAVSVAAEVNKMSQPQVCTIFFYTNQKRIEAAATGAALFYPSLGRNFYRKKCVVSTNVRKTWWVLGMYLFGKIFIRKYDIKK